MSIDTKHEKHSSAGISVWRFFFQLILVGFVTKFFGLLGGAIFLGLWWLIEWVSKSSSRDEQTFDVVAEKSDVSSVTSLDVSTPSTTPKTSTSTIDEDLWAQALIELESEGRRTGLWAKSFSESDGDETRAKAAYLAYRVLGLENERQTALANQAEIEREKLEKVRLANLTEEERAHLLLPKGQCPNCNAVTVLKSETCPKCRAIFDAESAWKLRPLD